MKPMFRRLIVAVLLLVLTLPCTVGLQAQPDSASTAILKPPYKLLTAGNQVTVRCTQVIRSIMAWNAGGTRILEKTPKVSLYSFRVPATHKIIFIRIELADGKVYSEKIGLN